MARTNGLRRRMSEGFTLIEILVTVLLIGILAAFAVPQYMKSIENSKAEDGIALVNMLATTNRMYALDHGNVWTSGSLCVGGVNCAAGACNPSPTPSACELVRCKYLAAGNYCAKPYVMGTGSPTIACPGSGGNFAACAHRRTLLDTPSAGAATQSPYDTWAYTVDFSGIITAVNGAPTPTQ